MNIIRVTVVALTFAMSSSLWADKVVALKDTRSELERLAFLSYQTHLSGSHKNVENRKAFARSLDAVLTIADQFIPSLTPDQSRYLDEEKEAIDKIENDEARGRRLQTYWYTKEYVIYRWKENVKYIRTHIQRIVDRALEMTIDEECLVWIELSELFSDSDIIDDMIAVLLREHLISKDDLDKMGIIEGSRGYAFRVRGINILKCIVEPLVKDRISAAK